MPRRLPEGTLAVIRKLAAKVARETKDGKMTLNASEVQRRLRDEYLITISLPPIIREAERSGYAIAIGRQEGTKMPGVGGRPPGLYYSEHREKARDLRCQGLTLRAIAEILGISAERVRVFTADLPKQHTDDRKEK